MIRHQRRKKRGNGLIVFLKIVKDIAPVAKDAVNIGKNTYDIIKEIKKKKPVGDIEDVINRINKIKSGNGFAYI